MEINNKNLEWYNHLSTVPNNAKETIRGGKLSGKTSIKPMYRLKSLTELFGKVGFGWYIDNVKHWTETAANESSAWVELDLFVKDPESGEWSRPIHGIGGSKQCGKGQGDGINDEAFKCAYTDAISVACKALGMAADVYWAEDAGSKYAAYYQQPAAPAPQQPAPPVVMQPAQTAPLPDIGAVVAEVNAAQTPDELESVWNKYRVQFGNCNPFLEAVAKHPQNANNPKNKKKR